MIARLLEKALEFLLGPIQPAPVPEPPAPEPTPDPKEAAAEMRALASWLTSKADKLDPLVIPELSIPPVGLPRRWNVFLDECGESGGTVKRAGSGIRLEPQPPTSGRPTISADDPDPEAEAVEEIAQEMAKRFKLDHPSEDVAPRGAPPRPRTWTPTRPWPSRAHR